ncbi:LrgB family protein [Enterococcus gallinarum]|uniref:LrgB family protein n=1 Tax=Enterococcus gallinarum TaxID=1353 RepID=UPI0018A9E05F|nr:LrgB family protein [Enterococcus gallinarum]
MEKSVLFICLTIFGYFIGQTIQKKTKIELINPILFGIVFVIFLLQVFKIDVQTYQIGTKGFSYLLTPATICLAVPLYENYVMIKKNFLIIIISVLTGTIVNLFSIFILSKYFNFSQTEFATILPKSVTTAIGVNISENIGGVTSLSIPIIIITGVFGNLVAFPVLRSINIQSPISKGLGIGVSSHVIGTSKAIQNGTIEGAYSGISLILTGILTIFLAPVFSFLF